jgi:hypothetical protein
MDKRNAKTDQTLGWISVSLLLLAAGSTAGVIYLLDAEPSERNFVITGGLAGAAASTFALLVRSRGWEYLRGSIRGYGVFAGYVAFVAGFAAGSFSVLTAIGLLTTGGAPRNMSAAAVFGGIFGLALGSSTSQLIPSTPGLGEANGSIFGSALQRLGEELAAPVFVNYDGYVWADFALADERGLIVGHLMGQFIPRTLLQDRGYRPDRRPQARVLVQGGEERDAAQFIVSVVGGAQIAGYPRRINVTAPVDRESEVFEFTLVREEIEGARDEKGEATPEPKDLEGAAVLVDISQGGRTIQLLEVRPPPASKSRINIDLGVDPKAP